MGVFGHLLALFLVLAEAAALSVFAILAVALVPSIVLASVTLLLSTLLAVATFPQTLDRDLLLAAFLDLLRLVAPVNFQTSSIAASFALSATFLSVDFNNNSQVRHSAR